MVSLKVALQVGALCRHNSTASMQSKISSFFKPPPSTNPPPTVSDAEDELAVWLNTRHQVINTYKRRSLKSPNGSQVNVEQGPDTSAKPTLRDACSRKVLNKKRSYAQFHLDLGQSDFNLHTCSTCGVKYSPGEERDEKEHKAFHKNYTHGIPFKVLQNERVIHMPCNEGERVVLVLESDPPAQRNKVQDVIKMMEIELGGGWIFHKLCKVYLFISAQRVTGCVVAEPIKEAFELLSCTIDGGSTDITKKDSRLRSTTLQFGEIILRREPVKKAPSVNATEMLCRKHSGALVCKEEPVPAACGIRAIWVTPCNRRKRIASQLLDAVRRSFSTDSVLEPSRLVFSPPTSAGTALASSYVGTTSFLVYKPRANER